MGILQKLLHIRRCETHDQQTSECGDDGCEEEVHLALPIALLGPATTAQSPHPSDRKGLLISPTTQSLHYCRPVHRRHGDHHMAVNKASSDEQSYQAACHVPRIPTCW